MPDKIEPQVGQGDDGSVGKGREMPATDVSGGVEGWRKVFASFVDAAKGTDAMRNKPIIVDGVEITDPKNVLRNMKEALGLLPACVKPDLEDLFFKSLPGKKVGESTKEGAAIDPMMLLHPAHRLAHVIAHETAHRKNTVPNEGLVEIYLRAIGVVEDGHADAAKTTAKYDKVLAGFSELLDRMSEGHDPRITTLEIYKFYYEGKYENIYKMYVDRYVQRLPSAIAKTNAIKFFWEIFPELEYDTKGQTGHHPFF